MAVETAPTHDELYAIGEAKVKTDETSLSVLPGDISDLLLLGASAMADHIVGWVDRRIAATYMDGAQREQLDRLIDDHFGLPRNEAVRAYGTVDISRLTAAAGSGTILAGTVVATDYDALGASVEYVTLVDQPWGPAQTGTQTVAVEAIYPGRAGNADPNRVRRVVTSLWDATFTITNPTAIAGGADDETDPAYRERSRGYNATIRRATLAALELGARSTAGVVLATVHENTATGITDVFVADAAGASNPTMVANVATELRNWRAAGMPLNVQGGTILDAAVTLTIGVRLGVAQAVLAPKIQTGIAAWSDRLKFGETLILGELIAAVFAIAPDDIKIAEAVIAGAAPISTPVATYGLVPGSSTQRIRILPGAVTFSAWGTVDL